MIRCQTKQWGNSLGLIVPRRIVEELHLKPHEEITIEKVDLNGGSYLDYQSRGIYENDEFTCEDGIEVGDLRRIGIIWFVGYDGTCLIKHINKVCETK